MFASLSDQAKVGEMKQHLLSAFPDEMDHIASDPNFLCAVCAILSQGLVYYGAKVGGE